MPTLKPAEFVRTMPNATPDAVVAAAAKAGIKIDTTYVSKTRGLDKARQARWGTKKAAPAAAKPAAAKPAAAKPVAAKAAPAAPVKRGPGRPRKNAAPATAGASIDAQFRSLVLRFAVENGIHATRAAFDSALTKLASLAG